MALQTWVARFVVDHGRVTEEGGRLRTFQRRRLDEADVDLHVLAEPTGEKGDDLASQALDNIGRLFLADRLSLTGGLMRALRSTHQTLVDWNRRSLPRDQVNAGVTAAIVSGPVVYLFQGGPSLVFLRRGGRLERLVPRDEATTPLGEGELEPALRRIELAPGDLVLAASPSLETLLDAGLLEAMLERGSDEALPELYLLTRDLANFALFAVTCQEGSDEEADDSGAEEETEPPAARPVPPAGARVPPAFDEPEREPDPPEANTLSAPSPVDISRPLIRLRSDQSIGRTDYARTTGAAPSLRLNLLDGRLLRLGFAAGIVLLVVAFVPGLVRQGRSEKLDTLVQNAQVQLASAGAQNDPGQKRRLLEEARRLASEALRLDSSNAEAAGLRQQASTNLNAMDAVVDLGALTTVTTLSRQITGDVSIEDLRVVGGTAYLLDSKVGRVLAVTLAGGGAPVTIYQDGESYGGTPAKKPAHFTWDTSAGGRLLVLDAERKLFAIQPGSPPQPLALRRTNTWSSVAGIAAFDGNLYVLDPKGNQVRRYLPAAAGFDSEPDAALGGQQGLTDAQGIAIDGDIYLVFKDGSLRRYRSGSDAGFSLGGIDRPIKSAVDIDVFAGGDTIYLADSGNKRIVAAGKDGAFKRQFVSNAFTDLRAIAIDQSGTQLYVVVGDTLQTTSLVR